jgi:hypothetical protein
MESDNPNHYKKSIETWDAIISQLSPGEVVGYMKGCVAKHLFRFGEKGGRDIDKCLMDMKKSLKYIEKCIEYLEKIKSKGFDINNQNESGVTNLIVKPKGKHE